MLQREGIIIVSFPLNNLTLGYYLPPKRHVNYEFFKAYLVGKKKVNYFICAGILVNLYIAAKERTGKEDRSALVRRVQGSRCLVAIQR